MAVQLSPGVSVAEVDLTTVVPTVSSTTGAFAGKFVWGPANVRVPVDSEITLVNTFGAPDSNTYQSFFTAASFLAYGNNLETVRAINANTYNAQANTTGASVQIANEELYQLDYLHTNNGNAYGPVLARYAGSLGNSIQVQTFDSSNTAAFTAWTYAGYFNGAPTTSDYVSNVGGANDEFHMIVIDSTGAISGTKGGILETYPYLSKAYDAIDGNGISTYWKNVILNQSKYIYAMDPVDYANTSATWGSTAANTTFARSSTALNTYQLVGGADAAVQDSDLMFALAYFANPEEVDVSLVLTADYSTTLQQYVIDNIVTPAGSLEGRSGDALAFISPPYSAVVNQSGNETTNIQTWLTSLSRSSSYVVVDSGWKYMYDKYNSVYRYVPLNGDIAGLCVYTDSIRDPWWSPAGYNRGSIKNVVKLAWNPNKTARDNIYPLGVNPVISTPGNGTVLFGDKTLQAKPSAFDRINVRRLFMVLEKSISIASKYSLFEFNDSFTQAQFVAMVSPFLREVQGRRGIYDYRVVCDATNNTPQVVDSNQFVGDIYIKPARSINWIQLNFIAVGTGVSFSEVAGAV